MEDFTPRTYRRRRQKQADALMKQYGIKWTTHEGRRALCVPSRAPAHAETEVRAALRREA